jgi:hypothetical protein
LEQVAQQMDEDIQRLVSRHQERESVFLKANKDLNDKAHAFITDAQKESEIILLGAKNEAETIAANSAVIVEEAKYEADAILAVASEEIKKWEAEKEAMFKVQQEFESIVNLNVGGVRFETSLTTLRRFPDTMIGCMFSGRHTLTKGKDGHFFIDRDGTHFRHILNFLRSPEGYRVGVSESEEQELQCECVYYGIDELMFPTSLSAKGLRGEDTKCPYTSMTFIDPMKKYVHYHKCMYTQCMYHNAHTLTYAYVLPTAAKLASTTSPRTASTRYSETLRIVVVALPPTAP